MSQSIYEAKTEIEANPDDPRKGTCHRVTFHREDDGNITMTLDFPVGESIVQPGANEADVLLFGERLTASGYVYRIDEETTDLVFEAHDIADQGQDDQESPAA